MAQALLGFDAREVGPAVEARWSPGARELFLLRDVRYPLSVDHLSWPGLFTDSWGDDGEKAKALVPRPEWIGANELWDDLATMEAWLARATSNVPADFWKVAITWHGEELVPGKCGPFLEPTSPATLDPSWTFLGYDVADPGISGLCDCGYRDEERESMRREWGSRLNEHHLFTNIADAHAFRALSDVRVEEHAPFFVLGLWRIA